jgi:BirA family biotin operon repressor/biotin-[acetyl-CoA-carboxylase] ligase
LKAIHLGDVGSTQDFLRQNFAQLSRDDDRILITAEKQTAGIGRGANRWDTFENSIAFSFTMKGNAHLTLSSLEAGLLISLWLEEELSLETRLKWPNDLMTGDLKKCGGILIHSTSDNDLIVGVGLNFNPIGDEEGRISLKNYQVPVTFLHKVLPKDFKKSLPEKCYNYILNHRLSPEQVIELWTERCVHLNRLVSVEEGEVVIEGLFQGIGFDGEALIQGKRVYSGTLRIN